MRIIHKTTVNITGGAQRKAIPGKIVHVGFQRINPYDLAIWYEWDSEKDSPVDRTFYVHGTGWVIPADQTYVGTAIIDDFVWHLYEGPVAVGSTR